DSLSVGNFANPGKAVRDPETGEERYPGVVVVVGDDPWSMSTSTPADSRYLFKHLHIPFLEPATPQELKDWVRHALTLSQRTSLYTGMLLTTFMAEGGGRVQVGDWAPVPEHRDRLDPAEFDLSRSVMVPPNSLGADTAMTRSRFPKVKGALADLDLDRIYGAQRSRVGFIAAGAAFETLRQAMDDGGFLERVSLFKLASSYPLVEKRLLPWLRGLDTVVVVEEKRGFLETELIEFCHDHGVKVRVLGKEFIDGDRVIEGFPADGGLSYEIIRDKLNQLVDLLRLRRCSHLEKAPVTALEEAVPARLPTFCPGCPHRETLSLLKDLRKTLEAEGVDLISHGDVGCYSLSFLPPFGEMHNIGAMGQGGSVGAGLDAFSDNPSVVLVGDSTFFHTGLTSISNSVQVGHDITYIVLDNDVTAMTGHQMDPRTGRSVEGRERPRQNILDMVRSMGVDDVIEVNPSDRYFYANVLGDYIRRPGTKVIVSSKECGLTYHARLKARDREIFKRGDVKPEQTFFQINTSACEDCRACVESTGCPGLSQTEDAYGPKMFIDPQICVADGYCSKIMACPSFEQVKVINFHPTRYKSLPTVAGEDAIPEPGLRKSFDDILAGNDWRVVVTGVGGSGVTTISRVLAEAAADMNGLAGLNFKFMDQKGLAQRNGRVTGHLSIYRDDRAAGPITPMGTADLVLSPDLLDGSQAISFLAPHGVALLDETFQIPLSIMLDRGEEKPVLTAAALRERVAETLGNRVSFARAKDLCYRVMGKSVYASAALLGVAYQHGALPFDLDSMREAFRRAVPKAEFDNNWQAFVLGRRIVHEGVEAVDAAFGREPETDRRNLFRDSIRESLLPWQRSADLLASFDAAVDALTGTFPQIPVEHAAQYVHDLMIYDRGAQLDSFLRDASTLAERYTDPEHQRIALRALAKTYFVKDEVFVSHALVSPVERERNSRVYGQLGTDYRISHINRPRFDVLGRKIEFDLQPRDWMLRTMRHLRVLRRLMPEWHRRENAIAERIRHELLEVLPQAGKDLRRRLMRLDNIKGYRETRYERAQEVFGPARPRKVVGAAGPAPRAPRTTSGDTRKSA
ncbi:MAG: thiamine pyrophosphate-dependent enzyme, partial [Ectothiorhodospiraceae bacterium]